MGNSARKAKSDSESSSPDGSLQLETLTPDELALLQASFTYVKQNAHTVALKGIVRIVDTLPESVRAFNQSGTNTGESYQLMNQGLIFMTGMEKMIERASDPAKLRSYAKQLNAAHSKNSSLKPHHMVIGLQAFESVIIDCLQAGYKHKRRASSVFFNTNSSTSSLIKAAQQQAQQQPQTQPPLPLQPLRSETSPATVSLFGEEHSNCPICGAWHKFFAMLYVVFDPKSSSNNSTPTPPAQ